ncbi:MULTISPECIES: PP2C family protein-serine/threonine phosphatase [unclassified Luteococcus]|uniref:PP2C family protein-serine/threonine phosphatase n=1 Tax=unclassified Luteococcus TaxID=2639923 RepID=UPI00313CC123
MTEQPGNPQRDHYTLAPLSWLAGCSDRGQRHETNQDALALGGRETEDGPLAVMVISDGVSTSLGSELSAALAAEEASASLVDLLRTDPHASPEAAQRGLATAFDTANRAVLASEGPGEQPGSCTLIAAVVNDGRITVSNVGDCRGYWIGDDGQAQILSVDDSLAQARIELGMSREEAERSFQAHAITRWLGPDSADVTPRQATIDVPGAGWLVVCSDGLWNYRSTPEEMSELVLRTAEAAQQSPARTAELLVDWANGQGGRDNITVALTRLDGSGPSPMG